MASDAEKPFIGGLSFKTTDDSLREHFEKWGHTYRLCGNESPPNKTFQGIWVCDLLLS
uniref:RRM domain-containing protein n=1 Tax=Canis lupus dingo TaxID=286419 RepID=A0A8C0KLL7_CANLU